MNPKTLTSALVALALTACLSDGSDGSKTDGESHFAMPCDTSATCGSELACLCGICTVACDTQAVCAALSDTSVCAPTAGCDASAICSPTTDDNVDTGDVDVEPETTNDSGPSGGPVLQPWISGSCNNSLDCTRCSMPSAPPGPDIDCACFAICPADELVTVDACGDAFDALSAVCPDITPECTLTDACETTIGATPICHEGHCGGLWEHTGGVDTSCEADSRTNLDRLWIDPRVMPCVHSLADPSLLAFGYRVLIGRDIDNIVLEHDGCGFGPPNLLRTVTITGPDGFEFSEFAPGPSDGACDPADPEPGFLARDVLSHDFALDWDLKSGGPEWDDSNERTVAIPGAYTFRVTLSGWIVRDNDEQRPFHATYSQTFVITE